MNEIKTARLAYLFNITARHFRLTPEVRAAAWQAAKENPIKATSCYGAIVNSLKKG